MANDVISFPIAEDLKAKFWERVNVGRQNECWLWTGNTSPKGYGNLHIYRARRNVRAHRLSYAIANGELPDGKYICHRCDNPPCCNPSHLFAGTPTDNARDRDRKGRGATPPHIVPKFTDEQVVAILNDARFQTVIAKEYGVDRTSIGRIKRGQSHRRITNSEAIYGKE